MTVPTADEMRETVRRRKHEGQQRHEDFLAKIADQFPDLSHRRHRQIADFVYDQHIEFIAKWMERKA